MFEQITKEECITILKRHPNFKIPDGAHAVPFYRGFIVGWGRLPYNCQSDEHWETGCKVGRYLRDLEDGVFKTKKET